MTKLHAFPNFLVTDGLCCTHLGHIVLLLRPLGPVWGGGPPDLREASVLLVFTGPQGLQTFLSVPVLSVTHIALQT